MVSKRARSCKRVSFVLLVVFPAAVLTYIWFGTTHEETLYDLLGVASDASATQIKRAYHKLAMRLHPDKVRDASAKEQSEALFKRVAMAHETLTDKGKRETYDATLKGLNPSLNDPPPAEDKRAYPEDVRPPDEPPPPTLGEKVRTWVVESEEGRWLARGCCGLATLLLLWAQLLLPWIRVKQSEWAAQAMLAAEAKRKAAESQTKRAANGKAARRAQQPAESTVRTCRFCDVVIEEDALMATHTGGKRHQKLAALAGVTGDAARDDCWVWRVPEQRIEQPAEATREGLYTGPLSLPPAPVTSQHGGGKRGSGRWSKVKSG